MSEYFKLLRFLKGRVGLLILACVCMGASTIFNGVSIGMIVPVADKVLTNKQIIVPADLPVFVQSFVAKINSLEPGFLLKIIPFMIITLFLLKGLFLFLQGYLMDMVGLKSIIHIRQLLYNKLQELSLDFYSKTRTGELISRITNDTGLLRNALSFALADTVYQSMNLIMFTSIVFFINRKLALISFVVLPLIVFPVVRIGKKLKKLSKGSQERMADINTILNETIGGVRIVKGFSREDYEIKRFWRINYDVYKFLIKQTKRTLLISPLTEFVGALAAITIFYLGGKEVLGGRLSFGVFGLFLGSLMSMIKPFKKLSEVHAINQQALAASARVYDILDRKPLVYDEPSAFCIQPPRNQIIFEDVWFKYDEEDDFVLKNINIKVNTNETTAIVGPTGSGKSTLLNFLPRFYDPTQGRILFDSQDIKKAKISSLRDMIGLVTQDMILFNDTVRANIAYGKLEATIEEIHEAARKAIAYDFIMRLPMGFDTAIGDRGFRLSGGEKQRICIARAILKNPKILILDEATSQLDAESEDLVQRALSNLMQNKTVFVIAHRLATVRNASRILVIKEGKVIEKGTHKELINNSIVYRNLYDLQFNS